MSLKGSLLASAENHPTPRTSGFIRVDSVHQGGLGGVKDLWRIDPVNEISRFQFVGPIERIAENFLLANRYLKIPCFVLMLG
uniref:Uncharacterized protein n=1 Tax=Candidatus Kentrum sp. SD TaxID=2126332 RepID=A0A451BNT5_9GAMM|nr:MAG: hypothetical protein BECKSD772F_GA0070984_10886 [Candidatus Kentron sp. SD]VFK46975.1 MAG: hypothetical protein BECKSD772E_GA0070983_10856 [Candidatus Kentron sp. SD]VFK79940.1 MAG: hypothetical protein BECKSD772D_GA0070982_107510 [Candidatus Kentron sp. SD]